MRPKVKESKHDEVTTAVGKVRIRIEGGLQSSRNRSSIGGKELPSCCRNIALIPSYSSQIRTQTGRFFTRDKNACSSVLFMIKKTKRGNISSKRPFFQALIAREISETETETEK